MIRGSLFDHAQVYKLGQTVRLADGAIYWMSPNGLMHYNPTRYQKEKTMKPGPYKSSTHGNINVSMEARELLDSLRKAVTGAIAGDDFNADGQALSRARGNIAQYISQLEARQSPLRMARYPWRSYTAEIGQFPSTPKPRPCCVMVDDPCAEGGESASQRLSVLNFYFDESTKLKKGKTPVTDTKTAEPAPKARSQLFTDASIELINAQRDLENILGADTKPPRSTYLHDAGVMGSAIVPLILEQWDALAKKATARAKARVAKAEKAVAALLAG